METGNRIIETGIFPLADLDQKTSFSKYFTINMKSPNPILETGNRIIGTGNGIIFHTCRLLIKKLLSQNIFH